MPFLNLETPSLNTPQALDLVKDPILYESCPLSTSNSASPFFVKISFPFINLVKFFLFKNLYFNLATIGFSKAIPKELKIRGKTKNLKQAAEEIGFPGKPKKHILLLNFANIIGFPGLMLAPLKKLFNLNCYITFGIKSNFPADTAPEVMTKSDLDFIFF